MKAYPNPTTGKFILTYKMQWLAFEIYNSLGQKISVPSIINKLEIEIDLSSQPNGIYFIKVGSVARKVIKE
jgi:hypothetical protein